MERAAVVGNVKARFQEQLRNEGFKIDEMRAEVVFCVGGDGTFMMAEAMYPGVPKVFIKHPWTCKKCRHNVRPIIKEFKDGKYKIIEMIKLEAVVNNDKKKKLVAFNDINIHYTLPNALRFNLTINSKKVKGTIIGDGAVIATPYGSSGYYGSITRKTFKKGMGVAVNNPTIPVKKQVVGEDSVIEVEIKRGPGKMAADCLKKVIDLAEGDVIRIKKAVGDAFVIQLKGKDMKITDY